MNKTKLFLTSLPIGNFDDISMKSLNVVKEADLIIGEEFKPTIRFLKKVGLNNPKFELLNEHSTKEEILKLVEKIYHSKLVCLFSDCGLPSFEDPAKKIFPFLNKSKVTISVIPGATALTTALSICNFLTIPFSFFGFLNRDKNVRKKQIAQYLKLPHTLGFYETPYRYKSLILDFKNIKKRKIFLGLNLTKEDEFIFEGNITKLIPLLDKLPKADPVILISPI